MTQLSMHGCFKNMVPHCEAHVMIIRIIHYEFHPILRHILKFFFKRSQFHRKIEHVSFIFDISRLRPCLVPIRVRETQSFAFTVFCNYEVLQYFATRVLSSTSRNLRLRGFITFFFWQSLKIRPFEFFFIL